MVIFACELLEIKQRAVITEGGGTAMTCMFRVCKILDASSVMKMNIHHYYNTFNCVLQPSALTHVLAVTMKICKYRRKTVRERQLATVLVVLKGNNWPYSVLRRPSCKPACVGRRPPLSLKK